MQLKPITVITVLMIVLLMAASGGCIRVSTPTETPSAPTPHSNWPEITVTSVRRVPSLNSLAWEITNLGNREVWVAPYATLYNRTGVLPGNVSSTAVPQSDGYGWTHIGAGEGISVVSSPTVPADATGAAYNVYVYYDNSSRGWQFDQPVYTKLEPPIRTLGFFS